MELRLIAFDIVAGRGGISFEIASARPSGFTVHNRVKAGGLLPNRKRLAIYALPRTFTPLLAQ